MTIEPQYTYDKMGNPVGVFLTIEDWNQISAEMHLDIPQWQKEMIDRRLAEYKRNPKDTLDWDEVVKEMAKEDEAI